MGECIKSLLMMPDLTGHLQTFVIQNLSMVHLLFAKTKGGAVALWLVYLPLDQMVWVQALARLIVLCSQTRHLALTVSLHPGI